MRIKQLPAVIANQIAAGEVIERPASVVKELLENALDAKASRIRIDIGYGGLNQISVADNGQGIVAEDLPLAIAAHATSKISDLQDLYSISSMGFRGEALASIASVSRLTIRSRVAEAECAMQLSTEGGHLYQLSPCARNQGTTIDVMDLFCNAPVRKKFLKNERSEFLAIEMVVKRFAMGAPSIAIELNHNGNPYFNLPAAYCEKTKLQRMRKLLGKSFFDQSYALEAEHEGLTLQGFISNREYQRSQNDKQWIYVNGRMVKDKLLNHALRKAYEDLLHPGKYPSCLLFLTLNPAQVDVNVHPTKHEVRFQQPRLVHDFISSQIRHVMHQTSPLIMPAVKKLSQAREQYIPPAVQKRSFVNLESGMILNYQFMVAWWGGQPYLIDALYWHRDLLLSQLKKQALPLAKRALAVPIRLKQKNKVIDLEFLGQLGIEATWGEKEMLCIRSLPSLLPNLQLQAFLMHLAEELAPTAEKGLSLLANSHSFDAEHMSAEEMAEVINHVQQSSGMLRCKLLSPSVCEEFFHV